MALIKCTECGKEFSDKAPACPNCGCPTSEIVKTQPGGSVNSEVEKQMLALVEQTLEKARKASAAYELAADEVQKLAGSTNINLLGNSVRQDTSRIVEAAVDACDKLYTSYQALIPTLDGACRPLLSKNPGAKAIRAVAGTIAWLNEESEIENNYAINFNGADLGNAVKAKYIPNPVNRSIQGFWEGEFRKCPDRAEAESFWKDKLSEHRKKASQAERDARQKKIDGMREYRNFQKEERKKQERQQAAEETERKNRYAKDRDRILEKLEYTRPAKNLFYWMRYSVAYITEKGIIKTTGDLSRRGPHDDPTDTSDMSDVCQVAVNRKGVFGLTSDGRVVMSRIGKDTIVNYGYKECLKWQDIRKIACTERCVIGLRYNGTCVGTRFTSDDPWESYKGESNVGAWKDIIDIACGRTFTAGLKADGTVCHCGSMSFGGQGLSESAAWRDIIMIRAEEDWLFGLKRDGTIMQTSNWDLSPLSAAKDIVDLATNKEGVFALQSDGHVVCAKEDVITGKKIGYVVPSIQNAVAVFRDDRADMFVLKENGNLERYDSRWPENRPEVIARLCSGYSSYQRKECERVQKRLEEEALRAERRAKNLCQHCGGELEKKLFGWKCKSCGQKKDY